MEIINNIINYFNIFYFINNLNYIIFPLKEYITVLCSLYSYIIDYPLSKVNERK